MRVRLKDRAVFVTPTFGPRFFDPDFGELLAGTGNMFIGALWMVRAHRLTAGLTVFPGGLDSWVDRDNGRVF